MFSQFLMIFIYSLIIFCNCKIKDPKDFLSDVIIDTNGVIPHSPTAITPKENETAIYPSIMGTPFFKPYKKLILLLNYETYLSITPSLL